MSEFPDLQLPVEIIEEDEDSSSKSKALCLEDPFEGTTIAQRYRIHSLIGKGATGSVYKAEDLSSNRLVALKILHSHLLICELFRELELLGVRLRAHHT